MAIVQSIKPVTRAPVTFREIKQWYEDNLAPGAVNLDDQHVYENVYHAGKWAGVFQVTQKGAQRFFKRAKPRSIVDIATLTSIYRPGPLAAKVDDLYVDASGGKPFDWGDKRVNEILKETNGCLIFQEQVMQLAHEVGGFPYDECDKLRKAIMKRTIGGGEEAKKKATALRQSFVDGAVKNGYSESVANGIYDKIAFYAGYGFNKSLYFLQEVQRYSAFGTLLESIPIGEVRPGDRLRSRDESTGRDTFVTVVAKHDHGVLPLVKVTLSNGETIRCTMDHKFRTVETGEMLPLWQIRDRGMSIVVSSNTPANSVASV